MITSIVVLGGIFYWVVRRGDRNYRRREALEVRLGNLANYISGPFR